MTPLQTAILLLLGIDCVAGCEETISERCQKLADLATDILERFKTFKNYDMYLNASRRMMDMDVTDPEVRKEVLCRVADAKTLEELYVALPKIKRLTLPVFAQAYENEKYRLIALKGGYTNLHRLNQLYSDLWKWEDQLKCEPDDDSLRGAAEFLTCDDLLTVVTDLPTLTHFLEVMQVKYGSRWLSHIIRSEYQSVLVEDAREFAERIYVPEPASVVANLTGLDIYPARRLVQRLSGKAIINEKLVKAREETMKWKEMYADVMTLLGDMGLLNLK